MVTDSVRKVDLGLDTYRERKVDLGLDTDSDRKVDLGLDTDSKRRKSTYVWKLIARGISI